MYQSHWPPNQHVCLGVNTTEEKLRSVFCLCYEKVVTMCCWYMLKQASASYTHPARVTMAFVGEYLGMCVSCCCVCLQPLIQIASRSQARQQRSRGFEGFWWGRCNRTATSHNAVQYDQFWMVDSANSWWTFSCRWSVTKKGKQHNAPHGGCVCVCERQRNWALPTNRTAPIAFTISNAC